MEYPFIFVIRLAFRLLFESFRFLFVYLLHPQLAARSLHTFSYVILLFIFHFDQEFIRILFFAYLVFSN